MSIVIGIDIGISSTKLVGIENGNGIKPPLAVACCEQAPSVYDAFINYIHNHGIALEEVDEIRLTGVGAREVKFPTCDVSMTCVDEFIANGLGARFGSGMDQMIVVSMGTGTSLVRVDGDDIRHIGGIGMGGGTLLGLSQLLLHTSDIAKVERWAQDGHPNAVNLTIGDICNGSLNGLFPEATASLFARAHQDTVSRNDIAAGLIHMVLETIGSCAVLSQLNGGLKDFVLIGNLTRLEACNHVFPMLEELYDVRFHIPEYASYCTALGAALSYKRDFNPTNKE